MVPSVMATTTPRSLIMVVMPIPLRWAAIVGTTGRLTAGRLLHKVHGLTTGVVARAVLAPVLGVPWGHVHVNRSTLNRHLGTVDDHRLGIDQCRRRCIANLDSAINARNDLTIHRGIHIGLCASATSRQQQRDRGPNNRPGATEKTHNSLQ
jgi:hypothetical protein